MLKKMSLSLLLTGSLTCFCQVVITGGTATTGAGYPSAANAPLISTPDIALPGSGPAVGAPLSSASANDSRTSTGPSVHNPNGGPFVVPEASTSNAMLVSGEAPVSQPSATSQAATEPFENGIQHFASGSASIGNSTLSLGQIARALRSQRRQAARMYTNDNITQMNARGVTIGNLGNGSTALASASRPSTAPAAPVRPASIGTLVAENRAPALPQSDREAPLNTQSATPASPTAGQQRHQAAVQSEEVPAVSKAATSGKTAPAESSRLPQTGSPLPLLLVLGGIGLASGILYWMRR